MEIFLLAMNEVDALGSTRSGYEPFLISLPKPGMQGNKTLSAINNVPDIHCCNIGTTWVIPAIGGGMPVCEITSMRCIAWTYR